MDSVEVEREYLRCSDSMIVVSKSKTGNPEVRNIHRNLCQFVTVHDLHASIQIEVIEIGKSGIFKVLHLFRHNINESCRLLEIKKNRALIWKSLEIFCCRGMFPSRHSEIEVVFLRRYLHRIPYLLVFTLSYHSPFSYPLAV